MELNDSTQIISIAMINMDDGTETLLFERKGSKCHFHEEFVYQNYIINLRLDWKDIANGEPMLDADIWVKTKDKKNRLRNGPWHHNEKKPDPFTGGNIYTFEFKNLKLRLGTKTTVAKDIACKVNIARHACLSN